MSDIDQISKEVAQDRARLASTLDALTDTVRPESIARDVTTAANEIGGALAQQAWSKLRDNPAGGILVAAGLGLMAAGAERRPVAASRSDRVIAQDPTFAYRGFEERVAAAEAEINAEMTGEMDPQPSASRMKETINAGLDKLPASARKRVLKARQAAISAQESIERKTRRAVRKTSGFVYEQPLTAAAIAVGFGVLAGSLLPGTRREDALMGSRRDALMSDARNALEEEMLKARAAAETTLAEKVGTTRADLHR